MSALKSSCAAYPSISKPSRNYRKLCASTLSSASFFPHPSRLPASRLSARCPSPFFLLPSSPAEKEVINIATAFRSWPSKGTKLCPRMGGVTPNPQSQNGSLRRPPLLPSGKRRKFRRSSSRLGRTEGGCGRYFCSRVTYYRTGRTLCEFR